MTKEQPGALLDRSQMSSRCTKIYQKSVQKHRLQVPSSLTAVNPPCRRLWRLGVHSEKDNRGGWSHCHERLDQRMISWQFSFAVYCVCVSASAVRPLYAVVDLIGVAWLFFNINRIFWDLWLVDVRCFDELPSFFRFAGVRSSMSAPPCGRFKRSLAS